MILALLLSTALNDFLFAPRDLFGVTVQSVTRRLGEPERTSFELIESPHDPKMRNVRATLVYPGVTVTIINVLCCDSSILETVRLTDRSLLAFPETGRAVRERFGEPHQSNAERLTYKIENEVGADRITFEFEKGRVRTVEWQYFLD